MVGGSGELEQASERDSRDTLEMVAIGDSFGPSFVLIVQSMDLFVVFCFPVSLSQLAVNTLGCRTYARSTFVLCYQQLSSRRLRK